VVRWGIGNASLWILLSVALLAPPFAHAQRRRVDASDAEARRRFRTGQAHYQNGEFPEAAADFEEAYRLSHRSRLLFNAYLAYRDMQDLPNSARALRQFLQEDQDVVPSEREQLQARLAAIDRALAGGQSTMPSGPAGPSGPSGPSVTPAGTSGGGLSPVGFIVGGIGIALGLAAIAPGLLSTDDYNLLTMQCSSSLRCDDDPMLREARTRGEMLAIVTDVLWITGAAALVAGVVLIFALTEGGESAPASAGLACTNDGCYGAVRTRF
jgi:hypothetical protein